MAGKAWSRTLVARSHGAGVAAALATCALVLAACGGTAAPPSSAPAAGSAASAPASVAGSKPAASASAAAKPSAASSGSAAAKPASSVGGSASAKPAAAEAKPAGSAAATAPPAGSAEHGKDVYVKVGCYECHGYAGQGSQATGPKLTPNPLPFVAFQAQVRTPRQDMPKYAVQALSDQDLADIYAFVQSVPAPPSSIPLLNAR